VAERLARSGHTDMALHLANGRAKLLMKYRPSGENFPFFGTEPAAISFSSLLRTYGDDSWSMPCCYAQTFEATVIVSSRLAGSGDLDLEAASVDSSWSTLP